MYSIPPDDGLQICPKHEEVEIRNKVRTNNESSWFSLHGSLQVWTILAADYNELVQSRIHIADGSSHKGRIFLFMSCSFDIQFKINLINPEV